MPTAPRRSSVRIPDDLSIVGFDNQELIAANLYPGLTTVALPHYEMGAWAVETLVALLDGRPVVDDGVTSRSLPCPLVLRSSVAARPEDNERHHRASTPGLLGVGLLAGAGPATYHLFFLKASRALHDPDRRHWRATIGHATATT